MTISSEDGGLEAWAGVTGLESSMALYQLRLSLMLSRIKVSKFKYYFLLFTKTINESQIQIMQCKTKASSPIQINTNTQQSEYAYIKPRYALISLGQFKEKPKVNIRPIVSNFHEIIPHLQEKRTSSGQGVRNGDDCSVPGSTAMTARSSLLPSES
jgi:hypothetical protein